MRLLRFALDDPALDVAFDEALLLSVESGDSGSALRLWRPKKTAVVLGIGSAARKEADIKLAQAEHVPVIRRHSGGGAVVLSRGMLAYAIAARHEDFPGVRTIPEGNRFICELIARALQSLGLEAEYRGVSDVAVDGRKVCGNAQARKKRSFLVHGTLLVDADTGLIARYLLTPPKPPDYRARRSHEDFMTTLVREGTLASFDDIESRITGLLGIQLEQDSPTQGETDLAHSLAETKYRLDSWNLRR